MLPARCEWVNIEMIAFARLILTATIVIVRLLVNETNEES